jgi:2-polyprenyl-6-methoxyphenol hydroxylase-like FAD-dependent oxidoreductase
MNREEISELSKKLSQGKAGSSAYLQAYKKARRQVEQKLTDNQRQRYKAMAKEWTEKKLPPSMQQRYVHGNDFIKLRLADLSTLV